MWRVRGGLASLASACSLAALVLAACSSGSDGGSPAAPVLVQLTSGEAALAVIGRGNTMATRFGLPWGDPAVANGRLYLPDGGFHRILGYDTIPTASGAAASFVLGQASMSGYSQGTSSTGFRWPASVATGGDKLALADKDNGRVLLWNAVPTTTNVPADVVVGKDTMTDPVSASTCTASSTDWGVWGVALAGGKLVVADFQHHRVLIWNSVPTTNGAAADLVLGQTTFTACAANAGTTAGASTLSYPSGVWSDGTRLAVADYGNHRVLVWNTFPTANGQAADLVLGQAALGSAGIPGTATSANTHTPISVASNGTQLAIADRIFNRVLVWNTFPAASGAGADVVLGQPTFDATGAGSGASGMQEPGGLAFHGDLLIVGDHSNYRYLVFR
jgi:hypothetical protein